MVLHFNVTKESRKAMIKAIESELGVKAKYLGVPSCAYQIGEYRVEKDGTLSFENAGIEESSKVIDACVMATGVSPAELDNNEKGAGLTMLQIWSIIKQNENELGKQVTINSI